MDKAKDKVIMDLGSIAAVRCMPDFLNSMRSQKHDGTTWIDIKNPTRAVLAKLEHEYAFHPLHLEDSLLRGQPPQVEQEANYIFLLLHFPSYDEVQRKVFISQVGVFLGKDYLITLHEDSAPEVRHLFDVLESDHRQRDQHFKSAGYLLYNVIARLLEDLLVLVQAITKELDDIEESVFDTRASEAAAIGQLRQKIIRLKRIIGSLKNVLGDLAPLINGFTGEDLAKYYASNTKMTNKLWETITEAKETVEIYKDVDFTTSTEKTNAILAVLTIIFTLTIPATVMGTLYGMNVPLPGGLATGAWTFLGTYTTLIMILTVSIVPVICMLWYFKRKHWF
jgi:magnesium transporter